jgi:hypothetical protein
MNAITRFNCCSLIVIALFVAGCAEQPTSNRSHERETVGGKAPSSIRKGEKIKYTLHQTDMIDAEKESEAPAKTNKPWKETALSAPHQCDRWGNSGDEVFDGCSRRVAKITLLPLSQYSEESFQSVAELRSALAMDSTMRSLTPPLTTNPDEDRVAQEQRNVSVTAYLFAVKSEDDRDFHVIIGDKDCNDGSCFFNVEVSALPPGCNDCDLVKVREGFRRDFLNGGTASAKYSLWESPVPVVVSGTIFYDMDHVGGTVGPSGYRPSTSWEIHPARVIEPQ